MVTRAGSQTFVFAFGAAWICRNQDANPTNTCRSFVGRQDASPDIDSMSNFAHGHQFTGQFKDDFTHMYVLRHSTHIIYDEATEDEAAFIKCTDSQVVNGRVCFNSSCILRDVLKEYNSSRKWPIWPTPIYIWPKTRILG